MFTARRFNYLLLLLPIINFAHNLEEWLVFTNQVTELKLMLPSIITDFIEQEKMQPTQIFGIGLIIASILPLIASFILWAKPTELNVRILVIIAFATIINSLSHIGSSITLGLFSPGLITGIILCLPYSVWVLWSIKGNLINSVKTNLILILLSFILYLLVIVVSWLAGYWVYNLLNC